MKDEYIVISLDFQMLSSADFSTETAFVDAFSGELLDACEEVPNKISDDLNNLIGKGTTLSMLLESFPNGAVFLLKELF